MDKVSVLDHGYVRYVKHMGDDLDVVNSAKVSFDKEATSFEEKEARLLAFLMRDEHTSTMRHSAMTFEVYAPLMVARQWWKYAVASAHVDDQLGWNESSRRYVTEEPTFYIPQPAEWRSAPENRKQGSGGIVDEELGLQLSEDLADYIKQGLSFYDQALANGVCAEQARLFLPAYGLYVRWRWTASLNAIVHFLFQRLEHDAQKEIQLFSVAVKTLLAEHFPITVEASFGKV
jgi:thymidylate synthase (FAD)